MHYTTVTALNVYPVKSCRGIVLDRGELGARGLCADRRWVVVRAGGRFVTQRELPRLALVAPELHEDELTLSAPDMPGLSIPTAPGGSRLEVTVWKDRCPAFDAGNAAARWLSQYLGEPLRLARFDPTATRLSNREWTGAIEASNEFSDGYPLLIASQASLDDLNSHLPAPLPMNRFRPNIVLDGLQPYDEDRIDELTDGAIRLRLVKPCTRCKITTIDQQTAEVQGPEPLLTLRKQRWDGRLQGVTFAQNAIILAGIGAALRVGQRFEIKWRTPDAVHDVS